MAIQISTFKTLAAKKGALKLAGIGSIFTVGADSKTVKGEKLGYNTAILYMMPTDAICPASKAAGCRDACLVGAGRGKFNSVKTARKNKTDLFSSNPSLFFSAMVHEIEALTRKYGKTLTIRLNGTSDIKFEAINLLHDGELKSIFEIFPEVQFYDYTKLVKRVYTDLPANYDLTLSYSGARASYALEALKATGYNGTRLAVVFSDKNLPKYFKGLPVVNGDKTDLRFLDPNSVVVGLYAKGPAKKDKSGFVVQTNNCIVIE